MTTIWLLETATKQIILVQKMEYTAILILLLITYDRQLGIGMINIISAYIQQPVKYVLWNRDAQRTFIVIIENKICQDLNMTQNAL